MGDLGHSSAMCPRPSHKEMKRGYLLVEEMTMNLAWGRARAAGMAAGAGGLGAAGLVEPERTGGLADIPGSPGLPSKIR